MQHKLAHALEVNPVSNGLRKLVATESKDTFEAVEEMPADKFNFRPTPQQNTFGHLVVHIVRVNYGLCSLIAGVKSSEGARLEGRRSERHARPGPLKASFELSAISRWRSWTIPES